MRLAVFSDMHSNIFALEAILADIRSCGVDRLVCAGDFFGYYPWAAETFETLRRIELTGVLGNHDHLILEILGLRSPLSVDRPRPAYFDAAAQNSAQLGQNATAWLTSLPQKTTFQAGSWQVHLAHGTPDDPLEGRFYPDNNTCFDWFPCSGEILILGHTHYPLVRRVQRGGLLLNPGSVGQPRDGDARPSWLLLDLGESNNALRQPLISLRRVDYDRPRVMEMLRNMGWSPRFIAALDKTTPGPLPISRSDETRFPKNARSTLPKAGLKSDQGVVT